MAAALVQSIGTVFSAVAAQTTTVLSVTKTVTAGNTIFVGWGAYADTTASGVTDNLGNTYARVEDTSKAELWCAPVTSGGALTTITATHGSSADRELLAAEFSGVGSLDSVGSGSTGTGTTATWMTSKTIPADGLAIGFTFSDDSQTPTAGSASGSPSTTIVRATYYAAGGTGGSLCYAIAGGSDVAGFTGTTTIAVSTPWYCAGGLFLSVTPIWTAPANAASMSTTPQLQFNSPISASAQHFQLQLDTSPGFASGDLRTYDSDADQTNWTYWNGSAWTALPAGGLAAGYSGNEVRYTISSALSASLWYRRVRAGV